jgi:phosphoglycerate dehydrogenase-like enzyme
MPVVRAPVADPRMLGGTGFLPIRGGHEVSQDESRSAEPNDERAHVVRAAPAARKRRRVVVNLRDNRAAWEFPGWARDALVSAFPPDWEVIFVETPVDGRGDGSGISTEALAAVPGAEIYLGLGAPREIFLAATGSEPNALRWMHTGTAGVASLLYPELVESDVILTNSAAVHAPAIAETVLAMILHFARGLDVAVRAQHDARWDATAFAERPGLAREIAASTIGIVGLGGIGLEVARRAGALGMNVIATRRSGRPAPAGMDLLTGPDALDRLFAASDYVVLALPSTSATRGIIGAERLAAMPAHAVLVNVSRGDVIDEETLVSALRSGAIRGAALDVFGVEPLPPESPLWRLPNVLITPHVSATTPRFWTREMDLIRDNITRYLAGRGLRNVVDKQLGY